MVPDTKVLILAGGRGLRLWPYSNQRLPKQFLNINGGPSLFAQAVERALCLTSKKNIFISTNKENFLHIKRQLRSTGLKDNQILIKEENYETGPSIFSAIRQLKNEFGAHDDEVLIVLPSDHSVSPLGQFEKTMRTAVAAAKRYGIVILGKKPAAPEESWGYIVPGGKNPDGKTYRVRQFVEKPRRSVAKRLIRGGPCFWNLGMFIFPIGTMLAEFCAYFGVKDYQKITDKMLRQASQLPFDKMIIEKADAVTALEAGFDWRDIGSWKAFYEVSEKDASGNANLGNQVLADSKNSLVVGDSKPVVAVGMEGVFIINHPHAFLAVSEDRVDALKKVMPFLEKKHPSLVGGNPFVSICTPLSKKEKLVEGTVESVLQQDYPLVEHLIIDSKPLKKSAELKRGVKKIRQRYPEDGKVVDVIHDPAGTSNPYDRMNLGIRESTGDIIGILKNSDVLEDKTVIRAIVDAMERKKADACWADLRYVSEFDADKTTRFWQSAPYRKGLFRRGWMPPHPAFFVRRWVYEKYGHFRTDLPRAGGYEFMLRALEKEGVRSCYIPKIVVKIRSVNRKLSYRIVNFLRGNMESYRAWKLNDMRVQPWFILVKPLSKVRQLFSRSRIVDL